MRQGGKKLEPAVQQQFNDFVAADLELFDELVAAGLTKTRTHMLTGLAPSSRYERYHPGHRRVTHPTPPQCRRSDIALSEQERCRIASQINASPTRSIAQVYFDALDQGQAVASQRSYYRIADTTLCPTRSQPVRKKTASTPTMLAPSLSAQAPYETLVWDITILPLVIRGCSVALHLVLDLYSRCVVEWAIASGPNEKVAHDMFSRVIAHAHQQGYRVKVVHSDNGKTMKATRLSALFNAHHVTRSHSRPHVSDDNPHVESAFSTLKGDITYPKVFNSADHAVMWVEAWVKFYNTRRHHPGLAFLHQQKYSPAHGKEPGQYATPRNKNSTTQHQPATGTADHAYPHHS